MVRRSWRSAIVMQKGGKGAQQVVVDALGTCVAGGAHGDGSVTMRACGRKPFLHRRV